LITGTLGDLAEISGGTKPFLLQGLLDGLLLDVLDLTLTAID
jgi:hypothetical protein